MYYELKILYALVSLNYTIYLLNYTLNYIHIC
jgi:hypothetical protein